MKGRTSNVIGVSIWYAIRCIFLHFVLGFAIGALVYVISVKETDILWLISFGILGGIAGVAVDIDHLLNYTNLNIPTPLDGRPLHIPIAIFFGIILIYNITYQYSLPTIAVSSSVIAHVLEDWLIGWF